MKKIRKFIEFLTSKEVLGVLWYVTYVLWFGFVGRMIIVSDQHIVVKILMIIGGLFWAFYALISHINSMEE